MGGSIEYVWSWLCASPVLRVRSAFSLILAQVSDSYKSKFCCGILKFAYTARTLFPNGPVAFSTEMRSSFDIFAPRVLTSADAG